MDKLKGKRILIFQQRNWGKTIGHFLAQQLRAEGCELAALTFKKTTHRFVLKQTQVKYNLIINDDEILNDPRSFLGKDQYSLAEICRELGINSIWPIVQSIRNYVKSYRDKYYYGFRQNVSDEQIVDYVGAVYKYLKFFFEQFRPDLIIAPNFVVLPHIMFNLYARKRGVKMVAVTDSKVKGIYIFTYGYLDDRGPFLDRVDELNAGAESENRDRAKNYIKEFREQFKKPDHAVATHTQSFLKKIRHELSPWYHILRWYAKSSENHLANLGPTIDYKPPRIILRDHYLQKRYRKFMNNFNYYPFQAVQKFVYFPLQFQPEAAIDVVSPFFSNQIEAARQVAMSLPDDYTLVVKEHPAMVGLRPPSYLEKIARTPNVKLIDYRIGSEEVLKRAALVVSLGGTTTTEAAFYRKPVIQLGDLGITMKLPNVVKHTDMPILSAVIRELLNKDLNTDEYERRLENYVAAAYDEGFDFKYTEVWSKGRGGDMNILWQIYRQEIERNL